MSYEYNVGDTPHEIDNPYTIENTFLLISSLFLLLGACWLLYVARSYFTAQEDKLGFATTGLAMAIFGIALHFVVWALSHMRFFFGRNLPVGLAEELLPTAIGKSARASSIQEILRQRSIPFPEPQGPLNGVLYSLIKPLIVAPPPIQFAAIRHFHAAIGMVAILFSLTISYFMFQGSSSEGLVSWLYLPLTGLSLATPFLKQKEHDSPPNSNAMFGSLVGMIVFAMLAPVIVPRYLPHWDITPLWIAPTILLITSLVSSLLFLKSLLSQLDNVSQTAVSCEQTTIAMNCPPSQLWAEIGRDFQSNWVRDVPNRAYINLPPDVSGTERGAFQGHIMEETQPQATSTMTFQGIKDALRVPYAKYLVLLSIWGMLLSLASVCFAGTLAPQFADMSRFEISRSFLGIFALGSSAVSSFRIGHLLWSRMYFTSRVVWIETTGTFQTSELDVGNQFTGRLRSRSKLTRIEDATLRVWLTDIVSVAFGKQGQRYIMAMAPADGIARGIAQRLVNFAGMQSTIVAPTSERDVLHAKNLSNLDRALSENPNAPVNAISPEKLFTSTEQPNSTGIGIVKFVNDEKGFGFITAQTGENIYFSKSQIIKGNHIAKGSPVQYKIVPSPRGKMATHIAVYA